MNIKTLVGAVGRNPASVLAAARALKPGRLFLVHTEGTRHQAMVLRRQCPVPRERIHLIPVPAGSGIEQVAGAVADAADWASVGPVGLDITGATKVISFGMWEALRNCLPGGFQALVLDQSSYRLEDASNGRPLPQPMPEIRISEMLAWYGAEMDSDGTRWQGRLSQLPVALRRRLPVGQALLRAFREQGPKFSAERVRKPVLARALPGPLPSGMRWRENLLHADDPAYLKYNGWLEELCLGMVAGELGERAGQVFCALGARLRAGSGQDEMDVVLARGTRVVVVEAKARSSGAGAGADLQKRVNKARRFFGQHVRVVFVHPVWGRHPPGALRDLADDTVTLVGDFDGFGDRVGSLLGL